MLSALYLKMNDEMKLAFLYGKVEICEDMKVLKFCNEEIKRLEGDNSSKSFTQGE